MSGENRGIDAGLRKRMVSLSGMILQSPKTTKTGEESVLDPKMEMYLENERLRARCAELESAIKRVVTQEGDDLCWRDVYTELAGLVGIEFVPQLMVDPDKFAANCKAFDMSLRSGGKY